MRKKENTAKSNKVLTVVGWILCVILVPMLIINCTLIIKSFVKKNEVPSVGGIFPMIVLTDSMNPEIKSGDLIFCRTVDPEEVEVGDVISFFDPAGNGSSVVTHQVIEIIRNESGTLSFRTKGTNNNTEDRVPVPQDMLVGRYTNLRIPYAGKLALFMQTTYGLIIFVFVPFLLLVGYDIIRRRINEKEQNEDVAALMAELEALKAEKADQADPAPAENGDAPSEETADA